MKHIQHLANLLNVAEITEDYTTRADLQISEYMTADSYDIHVITNEPMHIIWDTDVYYYQPSFDNIIDRIKELDKDAIVYVSDLESYLPEYEVQNYIEQIKEELQTKHEA